MLKRLQNTIKSYYRRFRYLRNYKVDKDYIFNDKLPKAFMSNAYLPDIIFKKDVVITNCGWNEEKRVYRVVVKRGNGYAH